MTNKAKPEDEYIRQFLLKYENESWLDSDVSYPDKENIGAIDGLAVRKSDEKVLAIEHTLIQPFSSDIKEKSAFEKSGILENNKDSDLFIPNVITRVLLPSDLVIGHKKSQNIMVNEIHNWLKENIKHAPFGDSDHIVKINENDILISVNKIHSGTQKGAFSILRKQTNLDLGDVVKKALKNKLPKLLKQVADKRILLLERHYMWHTPKLIFNEIDRLGDDFPELKNVDEICFMENMTKTDDVYFFEVYGRGQAGDWQKKDDFSSL